MRDLLSGNPCLSGILCFEGRGDLSDVYRLIFILHFDGELLLHFLGLGILLKGRGHLSDVYRLIFILHFDGELLLYFLGLGIHGGRVDEVVVVVVVVVMVVVVVEEVVKVSKGTITLNKLPRNAKNYGVRPC